MRPPNIRGEFKPIKTKIPGTQISETMPMLAQQLDKATLIRSMSYTPNGLFNHTAAIYQMLTGYPPDKVSPSGSSSRRRRRFPDRGQPHFEAEAAEGADAAVRGIAAPAAGIGRHRQGRRGGFLGKAYDPYRMYQDPASRSSSKIFRCARSPAGASEGPLRAAEGHQRVDAGTGEGAQRLRGRRILRQGVSTWCFRGKARDALDLTKEPDKMRDRYGRTRSGRALLLARRLIEAGTRFVQVNWPSVANGDPEIDRLGHARGELRAAEESALPEARPRSLGAARRYGPARDVEGHAGGGDRRIRAQPAAGRVSTSGNTNAPDGRDHWPYCYSGVVAGCGHRARARSMANRTQTASSPKEKPVHPNDLLATVYYALGIDPDMTVLNT